MIGRRKVSIFAAAVFAILAITAPASAQTTTATVTGTVKDAQGGVIPGATVTLISEARGTRTTAGGDERDRRLHPSQRRRGHLQHRSRR